MWSPPPSAASAGSAPRALAEVEVEGQPPLLIHRPHPSDDLPSHPPPAQSAWGKLGGGCSVLHLRLADGGGGLYLSLDSRLQTRLRLSITFSIFLPTPLSVVLPCRVHATKERTAATVTELLLQIIKIFAIGRPRNGKNITRNLLATGPLSQAVFHPEMQGENSVFMLKDLKNHSKSIEHFRNREEKINFL